MKHKKIWFIFFLLFLGLTACGQQDGEPTTETYDPYANAQEQTVVIKSLDLEAGTMSFVDIEDGQQYDLLYNNGVDVINMMISCPARCWRSDRLWISYIIRTIINC